MRVVLCPGFHPAELTQTMQALLDQQATPYLLPAASQTGVVSGWHIAEAVARDVAASAAAPPPLLFIGFSAGVVGAVGAAQVWQQWGYPVAGVVAVDGWGVPLGGTFPQHRLSHDGFTGYSSAWLGGGDSCFVADPAVPHLDLWRSPHTTTGWWSQPVPNGRRATRTTASQVICRLIQQTRAIAETQSLLYTGDAVPPLGKKSGF
ncbi:MAG: hypothetical protein KME20_05520 [Kaiparowitsia implicata GSE-PSE-MK54-09C]|nr:hypothetical protein [Kaiparowitsia implicata GSE-PSE-MK54-09C]